MIWQIVDLQLFPGVDGAACVFHGGRHKDLFGVKTMRLACVIIVARLLLQRSTTQSNITCKENVCKAPR